MLFRGMITTTCTQSHFTSIPDLFIQAYHTDVLILWGNNIRQINSLPKVKKLDLRFQQSVNCIPPPPKLQYYSINILGLCNITDSSYSPTTSTQTSTQEHSSLSQHQPISTAELFSTVSLS